ncbi:NADH-quinone oxidoreductase subunit NuoH [Hydrogenobacter hydrogenophilus]|uniref:NADH-quinone oxidoreductase subunit H n=1 Tax=Hydrogenobacter hydrogenophilus TaxID=35835 RepID=A0A285NYN6_9AQUI|nr:NADH-quinone oxidoreductase subunit NuoH [Hydrogenobacter hydrogenophilus]SNZ14590.1 NADH dehydrogenase subunit H [Hydrogenobacter hydrogenophilus]
MEGLLSALIIIGIKILVILAIVLGVGAYLTLVERKVAAHIQRRPGPMVVGWHGLLQPLADGIKLLTKEDLFPRYGNKFLYNLAIVMALVPASLVFAVVPFGPEFEVFGIKVKPILTDVNVGLLLFFALGSLAVYAIALAGWASNSKYALIGSMRKAGIVISYEVVITFALMGPIILAQTLSTYGIVQQQIEQKLWYLWLQPIAFVVYMFAMLAETGRVPFDIQEAEAELVTGFTVEYGGMKFGLFPLVEWYVETLSLSAIAVVVFLGGWSPINIPFVGFIDPLFFLGPLSPFVWFVLKVSLLFLFVLWLHWTLPRYRIDQITSTAWKVMLPLTLVNLVFTAIIAPMVWR